MGGAVPTLDTSFYDTPEIPPNKPPRKGTTHQMNADAFRQFYNYHFETNRNIWDSYVTRLTPEQFTQPAGYSHGSVRDQFVHLMDVDEGWFAELQNIILADPVPPTEPDDRNELRARWDAIEQSMRQYLAELRDDMLFDRPIQEPDEDRNLIVWQVLLHVANHGTDHRAQILRTLNDLGVDTTRFHQDYVFYAYDHP